MVAPVWIGAALEIAKLFAPKVAGLIAGTGGEKYSKEVLRIAETVTGTNDPAEALLAIKESHTYQAKMQAALHTYELSIAELNQADRGDARQRDMKLHELGFDNKRADVMLFGAYFIIAAVIAALSFVSDMNPTVVGILSTLVGGMIKSITDAFHFEFGSSRGSKEKSQLMSKGL